MSKIFKIIMALIASMVVIDVAVSLATNSEPFIVRLFIDLFLLGGIGVLSIVLFLRNLVFLQWDQLFPDLSLFFQAVFVFAGGSVETFIDLFLSFLQFPFILFGGMIELFGGNPVGYWDLVLFNSRLEFNITNLQFVLRFDVLGHYFWIVLSIFGDKSVQGVEIGELAFGLIHWTRAFGFDIPPDYVGVELRTHLIDPILESIWRVFGDMSLEQILDEVFARF